MSKRASKFTASLAIFTVLSVGVLAGCGSKAGTTGGSTSAAPAGSSSPAASAAAASPGAGTGKAMKLTFALDQSPTDSWTMAAKKFAELVAQKTNNRITIDVHDSGKLGAQRQALEGMLAGTIQGTVTLEPVSYWVEDIGLYGIPYLFRDQAHLDKFLTGDLGKELDKKMTEKGFRPIAYFNRPPREVTSNKAINSLADMKGLKIRVPESPTAPAAFKAMGAAPVTMNFAELYSALDTKVIDAQENPLPTIFSNKIHEVQKFLAYTHHQYQVAYMVLSEKTYASLSDEDKKNINDAAAEAKKYEAGLVDEKMKTIEADMKKAGITFTNPDTKPFAEAAKGAYPGYSKLMQDWITKIQALQ
jgi:tripartite ATP-independent transporter DctP family solute receptor